MDELYLVVDVVARFKLVRHGYRVGFIHYSQLEARLMRGWKDSGTPGICTRGATVWTDGY